jgi:hypothetical protein
MKPPAQLPDLPGWAWAGLGLAAAWVLLRPKDAAAAIAQGVVGTAAGLAEGTVKGLGAAVGIPDTDAANCQASLAAGDTWAASFYCPAGTFLRNLVKPKAPTRKTASKVLTQQEKQWDYVPLGETTCVAGICGPSFENQSRSWSLEGWVQEKNGPRLTPVAGIRG